MGRPRAGHGAKTQGPLRMGFSAELVGLFQNLPQPAERGDVEITGLRVALPGRSTILRFWNGACFSV